MPGIENLNLPSVSPYSSISSRYSQSFQQFVKEIADAKSKGEEDRVIVKEIEKLKIALSKPDTSPKHKKEQLVKLIYCEMLGHEVSFAYMEAVKFAQQQDLIQKRVAYVALGLFLDEKTETECMMNIGSIQRDLKSTNVFNICFGLIAASKVVYKDMMQAVLPSVVTLLKDNREIVRKKVIMALFHFWKINPTACDFHQHFHDALFDKDPAVMGASLIVYSELVQHEPSLYKNLTVSFVSILKQILDNKLPKEYNYKNVPSPWMQLQLLKILAHLGSDDINQSKQMYEVLRQCLETTCTDQIIGCSILYECMKTVSTIYVNRNLMESSATKASIFLLSDDYNLKYLGIKALTDFVAIDVSYASRHQQVIIDCLNDQDDSLKRKTLDLLYRMTNVTNVKVICEKMVQYLRSTIDDYVRGDLVTRITTIAEKYAPDNEWYIETMNEVFELGGNLVPDDIAHNTMRIIGEGVDDENNEEENEESSATVELRRNAVFAYVNLMEKLMLPDILVKLICWVVGEYIDEEDGYDIGEIINKFYAMLHRRFHDVYTHSWIVTAITKILARCPEPQKYFRTLNPSFLNPDAQQRYLELKAIIDLSVEVQDILPYDASCEDLEVDEDLSFLDEFVKRAVENGASVYMPHKADREHAGSKQDGQKGGLIFVYEPKPEPQPQPAVLKEEIFHREEPNQLTRVQSPPLQTKSDNRLSKENKWTKEGRRRQLSESTDLNDSQSPRQQEISSTNLVDNSTRQSPDEHSSGSTKSSESSSRIKEPNLKSQKDEQLISALFGGSGGRSSSLMGDVTGGGGGTAGKSRKPRQRTKQSKPQADLLGGLIETTQSSDLSSQGDPQGTSMPQPDDLIDPSSSHTPFQGDLFDQQSMLQDTLPRGLLDQSSIVDEAVTEEGTEMCDLLDGLELQGNRREQPNSSTEGNIKNPLEVDIYDKPLSSLVHQETTSNTISLQDSLTTPAVNLETSKLPKELQNFPCSSMTDIASDICVRITSQNVYMPTELAMVVFLLNKTSNPLKNITFTFTPPSSLRGHTEELHFQREAELDGTNSLCHVVHLRYHSPSARMVVNGNISYRDYTNTEKKVFLNITHQWSDLLRPACISTDVFGERWLNRSLHERKHTLQKSLQANQLSNKLQDLNVNVIQQIGNELIAGSTVLGKEEILMHFNTTKSTVECKLKSASERLNEYVQQMITSSL